MYRGIDTGLGKLNINITKCVKDGNATIAKFKASFQALKTEKSSMVKIYPFLPTILCMYVSSGIQLFGQALQDIYETLVRCEETTIVEDLDKFIKDLIQCTES